MVELRRTPSRLALALALPLLCERLHAASPQEATQAPARIEFGDDVDAAVLAAKQSGKPVVVVFGAVWCSACHRFMDRTIPALEVRDVGDEFHWVYVDIDRNVSIARDYEVKATPSTVVLRPDGTKLAMATGAFDPTNYRAFLDSVLAPSAQEIDVEEADPNLLNWTPKGYRSQSLCFSQVGYGPLSLPSQAPAQVLRMNLLPRTPSTLADGQFELNWTESFANVFAFEENDYRLDYLTLNSTLSLAYGLTDTVQAEITVGNLLRNDSYLDPLVDTFHDLFGLGDSGRDDFPDNENIIDLELRDGVEIEDTSSGSEATHVTLTLQHNLTCGTNIWPAFAYAVSGRWDAGGDAELEGSSPFSVGLSGSASKRLGQSFYTYLGLGYNWYGLDESRGLALVDEQWSGLAALEWSYKDRRALVLEYLINEAVAEEREPFDDPTHEVHLGWKGEIRRGTVLEIGLIENIINVDNSPDFGLHFGLRHRF